MKKILALLSLVLISSACSNTTVNQKEIANELCRDHGGFEPDGTLIPRVGGVIEAVCKDGSKVSNI